MFLAWREIRREKLRYGLVITMIVLISYLLFMLVGLMDGLSNQNTAAIDSWQVQTVWLNINSDDRLSGSLLTSSQVDALPTGKHEALVGDLPVLIQLDRRHRRHPQTVQFIGLKNDEFIAHSKIHLTSGHRVRNDHQLVLDESLKQKGYRLGEQVKVSGMTGHFRVVGFAQNAKINMAPIAYGTLTTWQQAHQGQYQASAVISNQQRSDHVGGLKRYTAQQFINKLPGYTAQNATLQLMIGFLLVISLVIIAVFLYILTMQKKQHYALLRAQGIPAGMMISATIWQALILMIIGVLLAAVLTLLTAQMMPSSAPMLLKFGNMIMMAGGLILIGVVGALLPAMMIVRIDPLDALK